MEEIGEHPQRQRLVNFRILYMIVQMIGITLIILMAAWVSLFLGGVGLSTPQLEFNWHPLLMTIGMIYLYGNCMRFRFARPPDIWMLTLQFVLAIILYRGLRYARKKNLKISHATLFGIVMLFIVLALVAVFDSHNLAKPPIPNLYSLHSWIGLSAVILFGCQVIVLAHL